MSGVCFARGIGNGELYGWSVSAQCSNRAFGTSSEIGKNAFQRFMISDDGEFCAIDLQVEMFRTKQDVEGFSFGLGVPLIDGSEGATCIGNDMVVLVENSIKTNTAGIDIDCIAGKMFQLIKRVLMLRCPCSGLVRFGKHTERFGDGGIIKDKSGTVVGHTEETANVMSGGRGTGVVDRWQRLSWGQNGMKRFVMCRLVTKNDDVITNITSTFDATEDLLDGIWKDFSSGGRA